MTAGNKAIQKSSMISNWRSQLPKPCRKGASHKPPQNLLNVLHSTIKSTWSGCIHKAAMLPPLMGSSQIQGTHKHKHRELCNSNQFSNYLLQKQKKDHRDLQLPQNCVKQRAGTKKRHLSDLLSSIRPPPWQLTCATYCGQRELSNTHHLPDLPFCPRQLQGPHCCGQRTLCATQPLCNLHHQDHPQSPGQRKPLTSQLYNLSTSSQLVNIFPGSCKFTWWGHKTKADLHPLLRGSLSHASFPHASTQGNLQPRQLL